MTRQQRTLKTQVEISGLGLHTGIPIRAIFKPAPIDHGVLFTRVDLPDSPVIPADSTSIGPTNRRTTLKSGPVEIDTVEHVLSACHGLGLDNLEIEINGPELPSLDGSARPIVDTFLAAGLVDQKAPKKSFRVDTPIYVEENGVSLVALPTEKEGLHIQYNFGHPTLLSHTIHYQLDPNDYRDVIAPARTFVLEEEIEYLKSKGLGKGATAENTIVLKDPQKMPPLRFSDEYARHKVLDLIGDLFLAGAEINARIIATKSGHSANAKLVKRMVELMEERENRGEIKHDTGLDIREVMRILPHRYPFLLIDRVIEVDGYRRAVGIKNVTINEPFFQGHWPGAPVMPGVLILEAMAQLSGVLLLRKLENTGKLAVLWAIDKVRLRGTVGPGDQLRIEVEALKLKRDVGQVQGIAKLNNKIVTEAELMFTMIDA